MADFCDYVLDIPVMLLKGGIANPDNPGRVGVYRPHPRERVQHLGLGKEKLE